MSGLKRIVGVVAFVGILTQPVWADSEPPTFSVLFENDVFFDTDRDYTNGVQFAYTSAPDRNEDWAEGWARALPFFAPTGEVRTSYSLGQNIYTPMDTELVNPPLTERPYAGFLYGAIGLMEQSPDNARLDQFQLQLGFIGPASLAEDAQKWVHSIIHDAKPKGWYTQLRDEPGLVLSYERSLKVIPPQSVFGLFIDAEPHFGGAVGNVYDYINAGAMLRLGFNLPDDFGPMRIEPGLPGSNFYKPTGGFSAYVFAGVDGRAVARNIFLDGNTWQPSRSVSKKNFVGDLELGAAVTFAHARLAFTHVFRTREYRTQMSADAFGAVSLSFRL